MRAKVLDMSRVLAGPLCGMILGDLGADVIKVERTGTGDETRGYGPPFDERGESAYFLSVNRNKKSLALDFRSPEDVGVLKRLIGEADVVIENFLTGQLAAFGIGAEDLLREHPDLIWCTISGFGEGSDRPGYDFVTQAEAGWMSITGEPGGTPMKVGVALTDVIAGKDAVAAILGRLLERADGPTSIERRKIHIDLMTSAVAALANVAQSVLVSGAEAGRWGNAHPNLVPDQLFDASDRAIVIAVGADSQWIPCAAALGLPELAGDPGLSTNAGRVRERGRVAAAMAAKVKTRAAGEWILRAARVPCGEVRTVAEALEMAGASPLGGIASAVAGAVRLPPPRLDEHGNELRALGWRAFAG
jgi:crotonobetainyl-CoA:carnitine CoA-transferase CaiB-like acyl-CoA transferase